MLDAANSFIRINGEFVYQADDSNKPGTDAVDQVQLGDDAGTCGAHIAGACFLGEGTPTLADVKKCEQYFSQKYAIPLIFES